MKKALIFQGGWQGHEPALVAARFARLLEQNGYAAETYDSLDCLADADKLLTYDLIVPCWTQGTVEKETAQNVSRAVASGVGLAGCHGGMCDAFRTSVLWQFMCGGQWVSHPGGGGAVYKVNISGRSNPITEGLEDFEVQSEQYYLHVDPSIEVLATTRFPVITYFHSSNRPVDVPQVWTKMWANGRVFYNALGHHDDIFDKYPQAQTMMLRGMLWAGEGKRIAQENGWTLARYDSTLQMF